MEVKQVDKTDMSVSFFRGLQNCRDHLAFFHLTKAGTLRKGYTVCQTKPCDLNKLSR